MDDFKKLPKMQHFKEGGSVQREVKDFTKRDRKSVVEADTAPAKKVVKKAFGMHDDQLHDGEKTDLSGLKRGGRAKKAAGTVKKFCGGGNAYKEGGSVSGSKGPSGSTEAKKVAGGPKKADAPSKGSVKGVGKVSPAKDAGDATKLKKVTPSTKETAVKSAAGKGDNSVAKFKTGGEVKKFAVGGSTLQDLMQAKELARLANARKYLGKGQQGQFAGSEMQQTPAMTAAPTAPAAAPQTAPVGPTSPMIPAQKRGGRAGKC